MSVDAGSSDLADQVAALVRAHRAGDGAALTQLYRLLAPWLRRIALGCRVPRHSVDDVVQATTESVLARLWTLRDPDRALAWVSVIARREALRIGREDRRADLVDDLWRIESRGPVADAERLALAGLSRDALRRAVANLPDRCAGLLTMLFLDEVGDYATIASTLDMPVGSIGPTRRRGLRKMRALLAADPEWEAAEWPARSAGAA